MKNLTEKSLLVNLVICQWSARKYDKTATKEVNETHGAQDAGRFNKILVGKEHLEALQKLATKARQFHYDNTLPWGDNGDRLLPTDNYFAYTAQVAQLKNEWEIAVTRFEQAYPHMITEAETKLGTLFNRNDYPSFISDRFQIKASFMPVPDAEDIRVNLSAGEVDTLRRNISAELEERFAGATKSIFERMHDVLGKMFARLSEKDAIFKDSLFENVRDLVELLPRLNVTGDETINELCKDMAALYVDPQKVRSSVRLRAEKAEEVDAILKKMDAFFSPVTA